MSTRKKGNGERALHHSPQQRRMPYEGASYANHIRDQKLRQTKKGECVSQNSIIPLKGCDINLIYQIALYVNRKKWGIVRHHETIPPRRDEYICVMYSRKNLPRKIEYVNTQKKGISASSHYPRCSDRGDHDPINNLSAILGQNFNLANNEGNDAASPILTGNYFSAGASNGE